MQFAFSTEWFTVLFTLQYILLDDALLYEIAVCTVHSVMTSLQQHIFLRIFNYDIIIVIVYHGLVLSLE
jgi:hypothetical protein